MRVLVIGGGIGGLAAAIALRRAGLEVSVFERAPELREVGAGLTLWTNAVKALRQLGVGPGVESLAAPLATSEIYTWNGKPIGTLDLGALSAQLGAPTIGIHRADLQSALAAHLPSGVVHLGMTCEGYVQDAGGVTARFAGGREERGDLLIGADGLLSAIRRQLLNDGPPRYAGYTGWRGVGHIDHPAVPVGKTLLFVGRGSQAGLLPIGRGRVYWFATANVPAGGADPPGGRKTSLLERFADWYSPVPAFIGGTDESAILRNDIVDRPPVRTWGDGRLTLLGDAAHPTTPNLGQGACQAIEDAVVLAKALRELGDPVAGLRAYEDRRRDRTAMITKRSWQLGKMLTWESKFGNWLRDTMFRRSRGLMVKQTAKLIGVEV
ncbi:MAG TPA: FAD-dependent monooxygenase [Gemmataceae bacterium]|nr:FAD-dependent monooxygenase [Gemmataceae bacterium]